MSFLNGVIIVGILDTVLGVFIWLREDFRLLPKNLYKSLKEEDRQVFIKNFGKGLTLTGICILTACIDVFFNDILRWSLFGFTLAYSDLYLRKARKLATDNNFRRKNIINNKSSNEYTKISKRNMTIIASFVFATVGLGLYIASSFFSLINNKPFENFISVDEVATASVYYNSIDKKVDMDNIQLNGLIDIFNDMIIYEESPTNTMNSDMIMFNIEKNDGTIYEIKAMGNIFLISINDVLYQYIIDESISEQMIFHAISIN